MDLLRNLHIVLKYLDYHNIDYRTCIRLDINEHYVEVTAKEIESMGVVETIYNIDSSYFTEFAKTKKLRINK